MQQSTVLLPACTTKPASALMIEMPMTLNGWWVHRKHFPMASGIYILLAYTAAEVEESVVLRVGMAAGKKGMYGRWFESQMSHYQVWREHREHSAVYRRFYDACALRFPVVQVHFLLYPRQSPQQIREVERLLINTWSPMWERRREW